MIDKSGELSDQLPGSRQFQMQECLSGDSLGVERGHCVILEAYLKYAVDSAQQRVLSQVSDWQTIDDLIGRAYITLLSSSIFNVGSQRRPIENDSTPSFSVTYL